MVKIKTEIIFLTKNIFDEKIVNYEKLFILNKIKILLPIKTMDIIDLYHKFKNE